MAKLYDKLFGFSVVRAVLYLIIFGVVGLIILGIAALITWLFEGNYEIYKLAFNIIAYIYLGILAILVLLLVIKFILGIFGIGVMAVSKIKDFSIKHKEKKMLKKKDKENKKIENMSDEELQKYMHKHLGYMIHIFTGDKETADAIETLLKTENGNYSWNYIKPIQKGYKGDEIDWWGTSEILSFDNLKYDDTPHVDITTEGGNPCEIISLLSTAFPNIILGFAYNVLAGATGYAAVLKNGETLNVEEFDVDNYISDSEDLSDEEFEKQYLNLMNEEGKSIYDFVAKYIDEHPEELDVIKQDSSQEINQ